VPVGRSWRRERQDRGGSGLGAGACRDPRPRRALGGGPYAGRVEDRWPAPGYPALRKMLQCCQHLLEAHDSLTIREMVACLGPGLSKIGAGFVPHLASEGMVSEPLDLSAEQLGIACLDGSDNTGMEPPPALTSTGRERGNGQVVRKPGQTRRVRYSSWRRPWGSPGVS
jgi:hypothetical protein